MKESYCLMFRIRGRLISIVCNFVPLLLIFGMFYNNFSYFTGKNNPILYSGAGVRQKTAQTPTSEAQTISNVERVCIKHV